MARSAHLDTRTADRVRMEAPRRLAWLGIGVLTMAVLVFSWGLVPQSVRDEWYNTVAVGALALACAGLAFHRPERRASWSLILAGFSGWVIGDLVFSVEDAFLHADVYPRPSDVAYLGSYFLIGAGILSMVTRRRAGRDLTALLDATIIASGVGVLAGVFVIAPLASDSSLSAFGKVVSSAYPVADALLLALLVRLWATPGARTSSFRLLTGAVVATLVADTVWNISIVVTGDIAAWRWNDAIFLASFVLVGASAWAPSMRTLTEPGPDGDEVPHAGKRLALLACGLMLPAVALLVDGATDGRLVWPVIGVGSVVMSVLVLVRMAGLLRVVQVQAVRLSALARSDALTGAPNRRTWDHELSRACHHSREHRTPLCVSLLDLDHFKCYNDEHGHQAGDVLLREAVAAWTDLLEAGAFLARYGGEEFAVLFPDHTVDQAREQVERLRMATPHGQTFSAGIALWDPATEPGNAVARADEALYDAKRSGRDRILVEADRDTDAPPQVVLQPIVDLFTGSPLGVEALSRFEGHSPREVFEKAGRDGTRAALEAAAIRAAITHRRPDRPLTVNVSLSALVTPEVAAALPGDLSGIVLDVTEYDRGHEVAGIEDLLHELHRRGARIAIDDWGRGFTDLARIRYLRPDVVKLDRDLSQGLDSTYRRAAVRAVVGWAEEAGAVVCAEGIETEEQWRALRALGVHTGQGYYFGYPETPTIGSRSAPGAASGTEGLVGGTGAILA